MIDLANLRPMFAYYGGKQRIARHIVEQVWNIQHKVYVEPFCGSAAVFFAKGRLAVGNRDHYREVLNDHMDQICNLFLAIQDPAQHALLKHRLKMAMHGRKLRKSIIADLSDPLNIIYGCSGVFSGQYNGGYAYGTKGPSRAQVFMAQCDTIADNLDTYIERLRSVYIESVDALKCIDKYDSADTLFYCDPPYVSAYQGHYGGYGDADYQALLTALADCGGSFILSGYPSEHVPADWPYIDIDAIQSSAHGRNRGSGVATKRIERLWIVNRGGRADSGQLEIG